MARESRKEGGTRNNDENAAAHTSRFSRHGLLHTLSSSPSSPSSSASLPATPESGAAEEVGEKAGRGRFSHHGLLWRLFPEGGEHAVELTEEEENHLVTSVSAPGEERPPTTKRRGSLSGLLSSSQGAMQPGELDDAA